MGTGAGLAGGRRATHRERGCLGAHGPGRRSGTIGQRWVRWLGSPWVREGQSPCRGWQAFLGGARVELGMQGSWWLCKDTGWWCWEGVRRLGGNDSRSLGWKEVWMLEWKRLRRGQRSKCCPGRMWLGGDPGALWWGKPRRDPRGEELSWGCCKRLLGPNRVCVGHRQLLRRGHGL